MDIFLQDIWQTAIFGSFTVKMIEWIGGGKYSLLTMNVFCSKTDGVVKTPHLVRCYNFSIITTYRM